MTVVTTCLVPAHRVFPNLLVDAAVATRRPHSRNAGRDQIYSSSDDILRCWQTLTAGPAVQGAATRWLFNSW